MANISAFIQARMSSKRLPSKVLKTIKGKPLIEYLIERVKTVKGIDDVALLTSEEQSDDLLEDFCEQLKIKCFRGDLNNVARRFYQAIDEFGSEYFVRINGDSPLLDPLIIERLVQISLKNNYDIVTNVFQRSFPKGQSVEILDSKCFRQTYNQMTDLEDFEHVTRYYYKNHRDFKIHNVECRELFENFEKSLEKIQLSVDTENDFNTIQKIITQMDKKHTHYSLPEIMDLYEKI